MRVVVALVAVLALPLAAAHATVSEEAQSATLGGWFLFFSPTPEVVYAGKDYLATLAVNGYDFRPVPGLNVSATKDGEPLAVGEVGIGTYVANVLDATPGRKNLTWTLPTADGNATVTWNTTVSVYPDLGVAVVPADETLDLVVNKTVRFGVVVQNRTFEEPDPRVGDVTFRFERWSDDHKVLLGATEQEAFAEKGAWWADVTFTRPGMLHVRTASESLGLGFDDAPYIHFYVVPDVGRPPAETNDSPLAPWVAVAVAAGAALLRRRA